jgi:superfamily II DNA or RNA helicase
MSYFADHYADLRFPIQMDGKEPAPGFREAQRGALFAIAAHFTQRADPAIVTMPTGSGKTAVLQACAYALRATRVLVLTPSRLVREQIAEDFAALGVLKRLTALSGEIETPKVMATSGRVKTIEDWEAMRAFDVVVATVQSISPHLAEVPPPPSDLFDLILVDEAHHSPALTWKTVIEVFGKARRVLFTATPFRRDDREIKGHFVFTYELKRAYEDGVFGHIDYLPVIVEAGDATHDHEDLAIARAAEGKLRADRDAGHDHLLMVRTDSRSRARDLERVYADNTGLRLQLVTGDHSLPHVRRVLARLAANELDGIICVNMLGEGFDLPRLKIAAVHSPHRSLAVTLQFIGRFARTAGEQLGSATFLAPMSAIEVEARQLYAAGAVWAEIIPSLSEERIRREVDARETLETFDTVEAIPDLADLSLYSLSPYAHVKVFRLREPLDLNVAPSFADREIVFSWISDAQRSSVFVTRKQSGVRWASDDRLMDVRYDVFIFYYDEASRLLFVCASQRADGFYRKIVRSMLGYEPRILPLSHINRALKELDNPKFFQVGMKKRQAASLAESYRIMAGSHADEAIRAEDARLYDRGHCFGSAYDGDNRITIGLSSASKIWSNATLSLPELLGWCRKLARKIYDKRPALTGSKLDMLLTGTTVTKIPARALYAMWANPIYLEPPLALFSSGGTDHTLPLTDLSLEITHSDEQSIRLKLSGDRIEALINFRLCTDDAFFSYADGSPPVRLTWPGHEVDVVDYLNDDPVGFMLDDWSRLDGEEHFPAPEGGFDLFRDELVDTLDWAAAEVDIRVEYVNGAGLSKSIQGHLATALNTDESDIVYWDHGSGETADFVTFKSRDDGGVDVRFYHCKGASGAAPGNRVSDVYEVCGQAVKGFIWCDLRRLIKQLTSRFGRKTGMAQFIRGTDAELKAMASAKPVTFRMVVVQPGIARGAIEPKLAEVLGAANSHLETSGLLPLRLLASPE